MTPAARPCPHAPSRQHEHREGQNTRLSSGRQQQTDERPGAPGAPGLAVELRDVRRRYGRGAGAVHAPAGVDLALPRGTFTAVMGPSGSGKSTFLQCAAGLDRPSAGSVRLGGTEIAAAAGGPTLLAVTLPARAALRRRP